MELINLYRIESVKLTQQLVDQLKTATSKNEIPVKLIYLRPLQDVSTRPLSV